MRIKVKKSMKLLLLLAVLAVGVAGCGTKEEKENISTKYENTEYDGLFDIEAARKDIWIDGQLLEIPVVLKDLPTGWTYEDYNAEYLDQGHGIAVLYYEGKKMVEVGLENYDAKHFDESIVYNVTIDDSHCNIADVVPNVTTKQEIYEKYGEPVKVSEFGSYYYGIVNGHKTLGGRSNNQSIIFKFNEDDVVREISFTYADLTK
ncbi:MAG: hypothetical protein IJD26_02735 [Lachnospiraceae bacterium]|nr:hypothetical protein [Lachnospiraceae bacterium]